LAEFLAGNIKKKLDVCSFCNCLYTTLRNSEVEAWPFTIMNSYWGAHSVSRCGFFDAKMSSAVAPPQTQTPLRELTVLL